MREFYITFSVDAELLAKALTIGWSPSIVFMENCDSVEEMAFNVTMAEKQGLTKVELILELEANAFATAKQIKILEKVAELHETVSFPVAPVSDSVKGASKDTSKAMAILMTKSAEFYAL